MVQQLWKTLCQFLRRLSTELQHDPYDSWVCTQEKQNICSHKKSCMDIHSSIIHYSPKVKTTQMSII